MVEIDILNTREYAIVVWLFIICLYLLKKTDVSLSFYKFVKAFFNLLFNPLGILLLIYMAFIIYILNDIKFFDTDLIKDYILWITFALFPTIYQVITNENINIFELFKELFKFSIIVSFLINEYTFNFWIELFLIVPITFLLGLVASVLAIKSNEQNLLLKKYIDILLGILIINMILFSINSFLNHVEDAQEIIFWKKLIFEIVIFTVHIPVLYFIQIYSIAEQTIIRTNLIWKTNNKRKGIIYLLYKSRLRKSKMINYKDTIKYKKRPNNIKELKNIIDN